MATELTPQDTEINIIGSGATDFPWYVRWTSNYTADYTVDPSVPDNWSIACTMFDNGTKGTGPTTIVTIDHAAILKAVRSIAIDHKGFVSSDCRAECLTFLINPDDADFDAGMADQVLQVVAYGEVVYS